MPDQTISIEEAARIAGVPVPTLESWAAEEVVPVQNGDWTRAAAAQARIVSRMRERGYSLESVKEAAREGKLAFGFAEDLFEVPGATYTQEQAAERTGLEPELLDRLMTLL